MSGEEPCGVCSGAGLVARRPGPGYETCRDCISCRDCGKFGVASCHLPFAEAGHPFNPKPIEGGMSGEVEAARLDLMTLVRAAIASAGKTFIGNDARAETVRPAVDALIAAVRAENVEVVIRGVADLEASRQEVEALRAALEPFARFGTYIEAAVKEGKIARLTDHSCIISYETGGVSDYLWFRDFMAARRALATEEGAEA